MGSHILNARDAFAAEKKRRAEAEKNREDNKGKIWGPNRLWMPRGNVRDVIFIDDNPAPVYEYQVRIDGDWKNWFTESADNSDVLDELLNQKGRSLVAYYTLCDTSAWTDRKGNQRQYELIMMGAKYTTYGKLDTKKSERGSLTGKLWRARRYDLDGEPSVGSEHEFQRDIDVEGLFTVACYNGKKLATWYDEADASEEVRNALADIFQLEFDSNGKIVRKIVPFNYEKVLAPINDPAVLREKLSKVSGGGSSKVGNAPAPTNTTVSGGIKEEDIPF